MELRHIRYFLAVARVKLHSWAAAHLTIAQPPLRAQIKQLEAEIGATLFHRVPTGAELTEAGRAFQEIVRDVPRTIERAVVAAQRGSRGETGRIRIGFSGTAVFTSLVPAAIKRFREEHPDALVSLVELHSGALAKALLDGEVDVAFLRWFGPCDRSLEMEVVAEEAVLAVLPVDHPAATGDLELTMLRDETFILFPPSSGPLNDIVVSACRRSGFEPRLGDRARDLLRSVLDGPLPGRRDRVPACRRRRAADPGRAGEATRRNLPDRQELRPLRASTRRVAGMIAG